MAPAPAAGRKEVAAPKDKEAAAAASCGEPRVLRTDLPATHRQPIREAIKALAQRSLKADKEKRSKTARWADYARALKASLDHSFEPHWHVLVGRDLGFACKKRNQTMGMWKLDECSVLIWKSPGIEELGPLAGAAAEASAAKAAAEGGGGAEDAKAAAGALAAEGAGGGEDAESSGDAGGPEEPASAPGRSVKLLEPATPEPDSEVARVVAALRQELAKAGGPDASTSEAAQQLRTRLTADFGPIWHIVTGSDFHLEAAENRRNYASLRVGRTRVVCFQHEQSAGCTVDWQRVLKAVPYLLLALLGFAYMGTQSLCQGAGGDGSAGRLPSSDWPWLQEKLCSEEWESAGSKIAMVILALAFLGSKAHLLGPRLKGARAKVKLS